MLWRDGALSAGSSVALSTGRGFPATVQAAGCDLSTKPAPLWVQRVGPQRSAPSTPRPYPFDLNR
jgi:hypothetical protein